MKIICVTGAPGSDVDKVAEIFFAAGVQPALPLRQDPSFTLSGWHEKVIAAAGGDRIPAGAVKQPGRFWEQFATNLFMENMQQPLWAWADTRSVWLLDFWQQFEPNLHFVLVYTSPQRALAEALAAEREHGADTAALMGAWEAHQKEILRFYHRNPDRTILVDAAECGTSPGALIDACAARWHLQLVQATVPRTFAPVPAPLVGYLAEQLRLTHPDLQALQQELESSLHALHLEQAVRLPVADLFAAVDDYQKVRSAAARSDSLELKVEALSSELARAASTANKLTDEKSEYECTIDQMRHTIAKLDTEVSVLKAENIEARVESNQILVQMHQLQENLGHISIENKQLDEVNLNLKRAIDELHKKVVQAEKSVSTWKKELDVANSNKAAAEKQKTDAITALKTTTDHLNAARKVITQLETEQHNAKEAEKDNELLLVQLHQVQEELEHHFLQHKNAIKQNDESVAILKKELDGAKANKSVTEKEKSDAFAALAKARKDLEAERQYTKQREAEELIIKEAQQENELLLIQLHQVQEELEHYFLEHKNAVKQNGELASRWQRMLERNPEYCDYGALELIDFDLAERRTSWRFTDLNTAGQAFAVLRFDTVIIRGVAGIAFAVGDEVPTMSNALDTLTTAQWNLLPTLCRILDDALRSPSNSVARLDEAQRSALREALDKLLDSIHVQPAVLRFDRITLKREQVNSDYEHLWLQLSNLSLGEKRWNDVDFRLACANVRPGKFGAHPKLEFPRETGTSLLENWFAESVDDFGDKLELRFALPDAMDMSVWEKLTQADHTLLKTLLANLPLMLSRLSDGLVRLSRPLTDWLQLADALQSILAMRTVAAVAAPIPTTAPYMPALLHANEPKGSGMVRKGFI